jgi:multiple sugar transport system permease protein
LFISILSTVLCLALASWAATRCRLCAGAVATSSGVALFFTQMLPEALIIIPIFIILRQLRLLENLLAVSLVNTAFVLPSASGF